MRYLIPMLAAALLAGCRSEPQRLYEPGQTQNLPRAETALKLPPSRAESVIRRVGEIYPANITSEVLAPILRQLGELEPHQAKAWDVALDEEGKRQTLTIRAAMDTVDEVELSFISTSPVAIDKIKKALGATS